MKKVILISICLLFVMGSFAFAQDDMDQMMMMGPMHSERFISMKAALGLSDEQVAKLKDIAQSNKEKNKALIASRVQLTKDIRDMMMPDNPDLAAVEAKVKELEGVRSQIMINRLTSAKSALNVLTKEQMDRLAKISESRPKMMNRGPAGKPKRP